MDQILQRENEMSDSLSCTENFCWTQYCNSTVLLHSLFTACIVDGSENCKFSSCLFNLHPQTYTHSPLPLIYYSRLPFNGLLFLWYMYQSIKCISLSGKMKTDPFTRRDTSKNEHWTKIERDREYTLCGTHTEVVFYSPTLQLSQFLYPSSNTFLPPNCDSDTMNWIDKFYKKQRNSERNGTENFRKKLFHALSYCMLK